MGIGSSVGELPTVDIYGVVSRVVNLDPFAHCVFDLVRILYEFRNDDISCIDGQFFDFAEFITSVQVLIVTIVALFGCRIPITVAAWFGALAAVAWAIRTGFVGITFAVSARSRACSAVRLAGRTVLEAIDIAADSVTTIRGARTTVDRAFPTVLIRTADGVAAYFLALPAILFTGSAGFRSVANSIAALVRTFTTVLRAIVAILFRPAFIVSASIRALAAICRAAIT